MVNPIFPYFSKVKIDEITIFHGKSQLESPGSLPTLPGTPVPWPASENSPAPASPREAPPSRVEPPKPLERQRWEACLDAPGPPIPEANGMGFGWICFFDFKKQSDCDFSWTMWIFDQTLFLLGTNGSRLGPGFDGYELNTTGIPMDSMIPCAMDCCETLGFHHEQWDVNIKNWDATA